MDRFTVVDRDALREKMLLIARNDPRVTGGAILGSGATDTMDEWSDLDLTFGLKSGVDSKRVLDEWTALLDTEFGVVTHFEIPSGSAIYRAILFRSGLELDLSVTPETNFGPRGPHFKLLFGTANDRKDFPDRSAEDLLGWCWHHVLHANSSIHRKRFWQAAFWLGELRNHLFALKCIRLGLPSANGRGLHLLPSDETESLTATLIQSLEAEELERVLKILADEFIKEVRRQDTDLAENLQAIFKTAV
jgi:hypothetical protein